MSAFSTTGSGYQPGTGTPIPNPDRRPIRGVLTIDGDRCFCDDNGEIIPTFLHAGDLFARFTVDPSEAERCCQEAVDAGYHGITAWTILNNTPGNTDAPWHVPPYYYFGPRTTPDYYQKSRNFARLLQSYDLVWLWVCGGIGGDEFPRDQQQQMFEDLCNMMDEVGPDRFAIEIVNELHASSPSEAHSPEYIQPWYDMVKSRHPRNVLFMSALAGTEDVHELEPYNKTTQALYYHGYRDGHVGNKADHRWTFGYEAAPIIGKRLVWDGEPCGPWSTPYGDDSPPGKVRAYVSVQSNDGEFNDESMGLIAAKQVIGRGLYTYFCSSGVKYIRPFSAMEGPVPFYPGFRNTAKLIAMLPQNMHRYEALFHGGRDALRVISAVEHGRADCLMSNDGSFVMSLSGEGGTRNQTWSWPVLRDFVGTMIHPGTLETHPVDHRAGDRLNISFEWGRIIVGHVTS
jgi:hypothetical protein